MQAKINKHVSVFDQLLQQNLIDKEFYDISKLNIEYMYAEQLASTITGSFFSQHFCIQDSIIRNKLCQVYPKIFELYPVEGVAMEKLGNFMFYTEMYLIFMEDYKNGVYKPIKRKGNEAFAPIMDKSGEVLSEEANKHFQLMQKICNAAAFTSHSLKLSKDFLKEHPEMRDSYGGKFLEDVILPKVEDYELLAYDPLPKGCQILNGDTINSFTELTTLFKGKALLIDCWGTWCIPCRDQFRYMDKVKKLMNETNMEMIYIAFEYTENRQLWESIMKAYDLKGYHFVANDRLKACLKETIEIMSFPNFIIIDKKGQIIESHAPFPSDGDKLYKCIEEMITAG